MTNPEYRRRIALAVAAGCAFVGGMIYFASITESPVFDWAIPAGVVETALVLLYYSRLRARTNVAASALPKNVQPRPLS